MIIKNAIIEQWNRLPNSFNGNELITKVRLTTGRSRVYDGTVLRIARKLRQDGLINFTCLCRKKSIYHKE